MLRIKDNSQNTRRKAVKLAILVLAHKNINQLFRLINRLNHIDVDIFIHFDQKWNITEDYMNRLKAINEGSIFFVNRRISVSLDTWSLVDATIELIKISKQIEHDNGVHYIYTALLSGQDYPIKNIDYILSLLKKHYPKPFIDCTPWDRSNWVYGKFNRLPSEAIVNMFINSYMKSSIIRKIVKVPIFLLFNTIKIFYNNPYKNLQGLKCKLYGGSAWWLLPDIAINDMLCEYNNPHSEIIPILKNTFTPEETFFQILIMRSNVASLVELNTKDALTQNCLTYAHFTDEGKPFIGHPYILTVDDFKRIIKLPHCFARKFDEVVDSEVLDLIDQEILNYKRS